MALYLISERDKDKMSGLLLMMFSNITLREVKTTYDDARSMVHATCDDETLVQPAVKIVSFHDAQILSYWLGIVLHTNWNVLDFISPELIKSTFIFYPDGNIRCGEWIKLEITQH